MFLATHAGYDLIKLANQRYKTPTQCNGVNLSKTSLTIPHRLGPSGQNCEHGRQQPGSLRGMDHDKNAELVRLHKVLAVAQRNGNALFIENIEREIAAAERGEPSPLIEAYLTEDERLPRSETSS